MTFPEVIGDLNMVLIPVFRKPLLEDEKKFFNFSYSIIGNFRFAIDWGKRKPKE